MYSNKLIYRHFNTFTFHMKWFTTFKKFTVIFYCFNNELKRYDTILIILRP